MSRRPTFDSLAKPGTYALVFECAQGGEVSVGAMGRVELAPGYLVYVGSAFGAGGIVGRLRHHLRPVERPHWHIDYLRRCLSLVGAWCASGPRSLEHEWAATFADLRGMTAPKVGFGSSDCECSTHLLHARWQPTGRRTRARLSDLHAGIAAEYHPREALVQAADPPPEAG